MKRLTLIGTETETSSGFARGSKPVPPVTDKAANKAEGARCWKGFRDGQGVAGCQISFLTARWHVMIGEMEVDSMRSSNALNAGSGLGETALISR